MQQSRTLLSPKSFVAYCVWMGLGILSMLLPWALPLWALVGVAGVVLLWRERQSLPAERDLLLELLIQGEPELHKACTFVARLSSSNQAAALSPFLSAQILTPQSKLLTFTAPRVTLVPRDDSPAKDPRSGGGLQGTLTAHAQRLGFESFTEMTLEITSPGGLWTKQATMPLANPLSFRVSPALPPPSKERFKAIIAQQKILLTGNRQALRSRTRDQFHSLRPYQYPDPIKDLDAKKSAKYGKPMVRLFESLHQHRVIIALDVGRSTLGTIAGSPMFDYFVSSILSLARNAIHQKDSVSFVAFSSSVHCSIVQARSMRALLPLLRGEESVRPCEQETDYEVLTRFISQHGGSRSIVLVFSDVSRPATQKALLRALSPLCRKHLTVALGVSDAQRSLDYRILEDKTPSLLTPEAYWELFYSYHLDDSFVKFRSEVAHMGGAALQIPHTYWMGTTDRVYSLLRSSMRL